MRRFSQLLDDLVYTRSRNTKLRLIGDYLKETPDPDRGVALAALTGALGIPAVKHAAVRAIAEERIDPVLLHMSRDYVGATAEAEAGGGRVRCDAVERCRPGAAPHERRLCRRHGGDGGAAVAVRR